jgi:hypothetical protein
VCSSGDSAPISIFDLIGASAQAITISKPFEWLAIDARIVTYESRHAVRGLCPCIRRKVIFVVTKVSRFQERFPIGNRYMWAITARLVGQVDHELGFLAKR